MFHLSNDICLFVIFQTRVIHWKETCLNIILVTTGNIIYYLEIILLWEVYILIKLQFMSKIQFQKLSNNTVFRCNLHKHWKSRISKQFWGKHTQKTMKKRKFFLIKEEKVTWNLVRRKKLFCTQLRKVTQKEEACVHAIDGIRI